MTAGELGGFSSADIARAQAAWQQDASPGVRDLLEANFDEITARIPAGLIEAGFVLKEEWERVLDTPGRGRMYGTHQASAPGDPPAPDTRALHDSLDVVVVNDTTIRVVTSSPYALPLEFGTMPRGGKTSSRAGRGRLGARFGGIAPRPHARPAATRAMPRMTAALAGELTHGNVRADLGSDRGSHD